MSAMLPSSYMPPIVCGRFGQIWESGQVFSRHHCSSSQNRGGKKWSIPQQTINPIQSLL